MIDPPVSLSVEDLARYAAASHGADFVRMWATVRCEDPTLDPQKQSEIVDPDGPNGHENSWGLTQIDLDYNPSITKAEAVDPSFSLEMMAANFAHGRERLYHCYKKLFPE